MTGIYGQIKSIHQDFCNSNLEVKIESADLFKVYGFCKNVNLEKNSARQQILFSICHVLQHKTASITTRCNLRKNKQNSGKNRK